MSGGARSIRDKEPEHSECSRPPGSNGLRRSVELQLRVGVAPAAAFDSKHAVASNRAANVLQGCDGESPQLSIEIRSDAHR
jgi:hypothetical protein